MKQKPKDCPCHSGARYSACCGPLHAGRAVAETPAKLMRSRYAAYSVGEYGYLYDTTDEIHEDRRAPRDTFVKETRGSSGGLKFMGLDVRDELVEGDKGYVLFAARIFEKGAERGFVEKSAFVKQAGGWRYAWGETVGRDHPAANAKTLAEFTAALPKPA